MATDQSYPSRESVDLSSLNIWGSARSSSIIKSTFTSCHTEYQSGYLFKDFGLTNALFSRRSPTQNSSPDSDSEAEEAEENPHEDDDEEAQKWAAIERLPTSTRLRTSIVKRTLDGRVVLSEMDVTKLTALEGQQFINQLLRDDPDVDNKRFLHKLRNRIDRVGIQVPTIEIRYENVTADAKCVVGDRALPTLTNVAVNTLVGLLSKLGLSTARQTDLNILHDVSGIVKPGRMTLLLGPPSSGKTSLLLALAARLSMDLKVKGKVTYNGHSLDEFVPQRTAAYVSQEDLHVGDMTVRETLDFSARCQGVGTRYEMLLELAKREKEAGIVPEGDVDFYMKATAKEGVSSSKISTNYVMRILGLDACSDAIVGDMTHRGISGGQKKRVTTGEIIVGPQKALLMDEISTGLDSSTTHCIVKCLSQFCHILEDTIMISLLQPDPETFNLFDDVVLISKGRTVYSGPREHILEFFETCGFKCPKRKGVADFLQEVTSRKDQAQYWSKDDTVPWKRSHRYVSVKQFAEMFKKFHVGVNLAQELATPYSKEQSHGAALTVARYGVSNFELFKANFAKEFLLKKRQSFVFIFRAILISVMALVAMTTFFRTTMGHTTEAEGGRYMGALFYGVVAITFSGYAEIAMTIFRLPVFFKQRDLLFYPAWTYTLPSMVLSIPSSIMEAAIFTAITYFGMGFAPEPSRFFKHFLLLVMAHINATSMFRTIAGLSRTTVVASTGGSCALMVTVMLSGFIIPRQQIKPWWIWGYWSSPMGYAVRATAVNEFLAPRWATEVENSPLTLGRKVLHNFGVQQEANWYWIGIAALFTFTVLFNVVFALSLTHLNPLGKPQAVISKAALVEKNGDEDIGTGDDHDIVVTTTRIKPRKPHARSKTVTPNPYANHSRRGGDQNVESELVVRICRHSGKGKRMDHSEFRELPGPMRGMVMPFKPLTISFDDINYFVPGMRARDPRLQLLSGVTGAFRPGILTALVGVSGAGKTTLMDVLAGRKTGGDVEGEIRISGFPKVQETFARVSGYCEQNDIHSPQVTVGEALIFSAWLRLPSETRRTRMKFVEEVMELLELEALQHAIVGLQGVSGLSTEQRKRLTIAVELVANPSIIFMDEPTSGLDARAAAIVMRTVRNTVDTGRTVVCTIHQPGTDIFESFDEILLMKRGGRVVYMGPLGRHSQLLINYFESIRGVPKIKVGQNPAMWMLEATSATVEAELRIDFADLYAQSSLFRRNKELVKSLSFPERGGKDLHFSTQFSQPFWIQTMACLWKQHLTYWRSADYNCVRFLFTFLSALIFGTMYWAAGRNITDQASLFSVLGAMYASMLFLGVNNSSTVQPVVSIEKTIFFREKAAGMYSATSYATAQVLIEIPYCLAQSLLYAVITYSMMNLHWTAAKFSYYLFLLFCTLLYFTYYGMMAVAVTPNYEFAAILASAFYSIFNLFSGFVIFRPDIPVWWVWYYWACPVAWTVQGLVITQFGDVTSLMETTGGSLVTVKAFVKTTFGMSSDMLRLTVAMPAVFVVLFAGVFVTGIKCFNFQRR